jgi:hypothetical protein
MANKRELYLPFHLHLRYFIISYANSVLTDDCFVIPMLHSDPLTPVSEIAIETLSTPHSAPSTREGWMLHQ